MHSYELATEGAKGKWQNLGRRIYLLCTCEYNVYFPLKIYGLISLSFNFYVWLNFVLISDKKI